MNTNPTQHSTDDIKKWLVQWISNELKVASTEIATDQPLTNVGISSRSAVALSADLEDYLDVEVDPTVAWEHPSIDALAAHFGS